MVGREHYQKSYGTHSDSQLVNKFLVRWFHIRFKKNTIPAAVNAAPLVIRNHASSSFNPRSSINHFICFISLITSKIITYSAHQVNN